MSNPDVPSKIQALVTQGNGEAKVKEIKFDATKLEAHEVLVSVHLVPERWRMDADAHYRSKFKLLV